MTKIGLILITLNLSFCTTFNMDYLLTKDSESTNNPLTLNIQETDESEETPSEDETDESEETPSGDESNESKEPSSGDETDESKETPSGDGTDESEEPSSGDGTNESEEPSSGDETDESKETPSEDEIKKEQYKDFYNFLDLLTKLELYAKNYASNGLPKKLYYSKNKLIFTYIREKRYNSSSWKYLAGEIDYEFNNYVKSIDPSIATIKNIGDIKVLNENKVDVIHMFAAMDMIKEGYGDLGSWGGDLAQLINSIKNEKGTEEELYEKAKNSLNAPGYFSSSDMCADLDAYNIYYSLSSDKKMSEIIEEYYTDLTNEKRINGFVDTKFSFKTYNQENLRSFISNDFHNDTYIKFLLRSYGVSESTHSLHIEASINAFADYLYSIYNGKQVNKKEIKTTPTPTPTHIPEQAVVKQNITEETTIVEKTEEVLEETIIVKETKNIKDSKIPLNSKIEESLKISENEKMLTNKKEIKKNNVKGKNIEIKQLKKEIKDTQNNNEIEIIQKEITKGEENNSKKFIIGIITIIIVIIIILSKQILIALKKYL